jgi:polysaccharide export outer membrane protein
MFTGFLVAMAAAGIAMAAVDPSGATPASPPPALSSGGSLSNELDAASDSYKLRPGDVLTVSVWKETDLQGEVLIRPDGGITFALAGELEAAGHTVGELTTMLEARIRRYIPDAVVTVTVKAATGNRVYVIGKVNKPGDFPLTGPIDVMQALSLAGGATPFADLNAIRVLRRDGDHQMSITFHYNEIARGRRLDQNILLKNGDTVVVP